MICFGDFVLDDCLGFNFNVTVLINFGKHFVIKKSNVRVLLFLSSFPPFRETFLRCAFSPFFSFSFLYPSSSLASLEDEEKTKKKEEKEEKEKEKKEKRQKDKLKEKE